MRLQLIALIAVVFLLTLSGCQNLDRFFVVSSSAPEVVPTAQAAALKKSTRELQLQLFLERGEKGWTVVKTDAVTEAERVQPDYLKAVTVGMTQPDMATKAMLQKPISEYIVGRVNAITFGDPQFLWQQNPRLQQQQDLEAGINAEAVLVNEYRSLRPSQADFQLEAYEPLKVEISGDQAVVFIHGTETYFYQ